MLRVADYVMNRLSEIGIQNVFLVTGRGMLYLSDALAKKEDINGISVHHEQTASYAGMAYSQIKEGISAVMVSTGCASCNAVTGVLCAFQDNLPVIFISGQNKLEETTLHTKLPIRTYGQQEANIINIVKSITKYAVMIENPEDIAYELDKAIYSALSGRKGPVWIDIPIDVQNMRVDENSLKRYIPDNDEFKINDDDINYIVDKINQAKRPVIIYGSGIRSSKSVSLLEKFINKTKIPSVYSTSAVDILDSDNDFIIGAVGTMAANRAANFAIQNSDLIIVFASRLTSMTTGDINTFGREAQIISVDIDEFEHKKFENKIDKFIKADIKNVLSILNEKQIKITDINWQEKCKHYKTIFLRCEKEYKGSEKVDLYEFSEELTKVILDDEVIITDAGLEELIVPTTIKFNGKQKCIHPISQGAMGFALPAIIGAHFAGAKNICAVIGDGSVMMNLQELQTISHHKIPAKIFIINNNCYAVIRKRQKDLFRTRTIGTDYTNGISCPDFKKIAESFNIKYEKISSTLELSKLKDIIKENRTIICEVMGKEDQSYIHCSYRRNEKGKFIQPPIEDQSPFLDRELFEKEMIIAPFEG